MRKNTMNSNTAAGERRRIKKYTITVSIAWIAVICLSLAWNLIAVNNHVEEIAKSEARANFNNDLALRFWATKHGGVYVPMNASTPANPNLAHIRGRDIPGPNGDTLTLMNPAYMIRQMHDEYPKEYGTVGRIVSLKPLNKNNAADEWERKALQTFEEGNKEVLEFSVIDGKRYLRLMQPVITQQGCLKCHAQQGYTVGNIRGGVGVAIAMDPLWDNAEHQKIILYAGHLLLLTIGFAGIGFGSMKISRSTAARRIMEEQLQEKNERLRLSLDATRDGIWDWQIQTGELVINEQWCVMIGYSLEELAPVTIETWLKNAHPEDLKKSDELLQKHFHGETETYICESRMKHKNGEWIWVLDRGRVTERDISGNPVRMIGTHLDITERKKMEEQLRVNEEHFRVIIETLTEGVALNEIIFNDEGEMIDYRILEVNNAFYATADFPKNFPVVGNTATSLYGMDAETIKYFWKNHQRNTETVQTEFISPVSKKCFSVSTSPFRNNQFVTSFRDITERKKADELLRDSESKLKKAQHFARVGSWTWDVKKNQLDWSDEMFRIYGLEKESFTGSLQEVVAMAIHPDDRAKVDQANLSVVQNKQPVPLEYRVVWPDQSVHVVWAEAGELLLDESGHPAVLIGTVQDITERKLSEEKLQHLSRAVEQSPVSIVITDTLGTIQYVNQKFIEVTGYSFEEVIGKNPRILKSGYTSPEEYRLLWDSLTAGNDWQGVIQNKKKNGELYWESAKISPIVNTEGTTTHFLAIKEDITDRKRAEDALGESEEKHRIILHTSMDGFWLADIQGHLLEVNETYCRMSGYSNQELLTMNVSDLESVESASETSEHIQRLIELGEGRFETQHRRKDGTKFHVGISVQYRSNEGGRLVAFIQDITERKNTEQALRNAQKMESIGTLAGGIAHDFNNLLNAIMGQSSLALHKLPKESPAVNNITKAINASEHAADLTRQLLAYSGRGKFINAEIDLNSLVKENVQMLEVSVPKTTQLQYALGSSSPRIIGDVGQIQQVIMNLIINAGEAMGPNPGYIILRTDQVELRENDTGYWKYTNIPLAPGSYAKIQVRDTGSGISQETLTRIFDPFFTTKFTGRGLGLAAVLGIIKGHKGGLRIESEEGKGTLFEVVLPIANSSAASKTQEKKKNAPIDGKGKTILIIDDDPFVFDLLNDTLTEARFTVTGAMDPVKGIEIYRRDHASIDLIILDYSMPGMDGKKAFQELLMINQQAKILLCSGYTEEETLTQFGNVRPAGFFQKPYKAHELLERMAQVLSNDH